MSPFIAKLKRRKVFKIAVAYAIVAWLLFKMAAISLPTFEAPAWIIQLFTFLLIIGIPLVLLFTRVYTLTPERIKKKTNYSLEHSIRGMIDQKLNYIITCLLVLLAVFIVFDNYVWKETPEPTERISVTPSVTETVTPAATVIGETVYKVNPKSIAVLPFANMSEDQSNDYFSDGISEELLKALAQVSDLEVRGRTSSFYFKNKHVPFLHRYEELNTISDKLNVEYILEGSVRQTGKQVRITVQLINILTDTHIWIETYERTLDDIFSIQDNIVRSVANSLGIKLNAGDLRHEPGMTSNLAAYDAYLSGRSLQYQGNLSRAIEQYEKAINLDSEFAIALSALAGAYNTAATVLLYVQADELYKKADAMASRAIAIAPDSVTSLTAEAQLLHREWSLAEQSWKKALRLFPGDYQTNLLYGQFLLDVGRPVEAINYFRRFVQIEPLAATGHLFLGIAYELSGESDAAVTSYTRSSDLSYQPAKSFLLVLALDENNRTLIDQYVAQIVNYELNHNVDDVSSSNMVQAMHTVFNTPEAAGAELRRLLVNPSLNSPNHRSVIAAWASYYGEHTLALQILKELNDSNALSPWLIWRPIHKAMRQLPSFKNLVSSLNLVDYWRMTGNWGDFCRPINDDDFKCN